MFYSNLICKIADVRKAKGITQKQLARKLGIRNSRLQNLEQGYEIASLPLALNIASVLGCYVDDIYKRKMIGSLLPEGHSYNLVGRRFGDLVVLERCQSKVNSQAMRESYWFCQCDCGNTTIVRAGYLRCGMTTSCGCKLSLLRTAFDSSSALKDYRQTLKSNALEATLACLKENPESRIADVIRRGVGRTSVVQVWDEACQKLHIPNRYK